MMKLNYLNLMYKIKMKIKLNKMFKNNNNLKFK